MTITNNNFNYTQEEVYGSAQEWMSKDGVSYRKSEVPLKFLSWMGDSTTKVKVKLFLDHNGNLNCDYPVPTLLRKLPPPH